MPDLWPFPPLMGIQESLEQLTTILGTYTTEQRIGIRYAPRQVFQYVNHFDELMFSKAKAFADEHTMEQIYVPVWMEGIRLEGVGVSDTVLNFDTTYGDWRVGGMVVIWQGYDNYVVREIDSMDDTSITLTASVSANFHQPLIMPVRSCFLKQGYQFNRKSMYSRCTTVCSVVDNINLIEDDATSLDGFDFHENLLVLPAPPYEAADIAEYIVRPSTYFDNGSGEPVQQASRVINDHGQMLTFLDNIGPEMWKRRRFLHWIRGKRIPFWHPTYHDDLRLNLAIGAADTTIRIDRIADDIGWYLGNRIYILLKNGTSFIRTVTSSDNSPGPLGDLLGIGTSLGQSVSLDQINMISFLSKVRSTTDSFTFSQSTPRMVSMQIPVITIPE